MEQRHGVGSGEAAVLCGPSLLGSGAAVPSGRGTAASACWEPVTVRLGAWRRELATPLHLVLDPAGPGALGDKAWPHTAARGGFH